VAARGGLGDGDVTLEALWVTGAGIVLLVERIEEERGHFQGLKIENWKLKTENWGAVA
jgi:hypothetical protein